MWRKSMPLLSELVSKGEVLRFDGGGFSRQLTDHHKEMISKLESKHEGLKVIAVLDAEYHFDDCVTMHFNDYLLLTDDGEPEINKCQHCVDILSYTENTDSPSDSEMGYIGVREKYGLVKRIY